MPCFLKFFSKSSGFNPTVVGGVNESSKCGRYIRHEELLPPIITVLTNGDLSGDCKRKTVTIQTDLRDLEKNTQVAPITRAAAAASAQQDVVNIVEETTKTATTTEAFPKPATNPTPTAIPVVTPIVTPTPTPKPTPTITPAPIPPPTRVKPIKKTAAPTVPSDTFETPKQCIKKRPQSRPIVPVYLEELKQKQHVLHPRSSDSESLPKQATPTEDYVQLKPEPESTETVQPRVDAAALEQTKTSHTFTQSKSIVQESNINTTARKDPETVPNKKKSHKEERVTSNSSSTKQTRDSGVHLEENGQDEVERNQGDVLNPPSECRGRKEGLMFARPKLSKEAKKVLKVHEKDEKTKMLIRNAIEANDFLNNYMDQERKELVINAMEPQVYDPDSYIIRENEEGSEIYVSEEGIFDVIKNGEIINTLGSGIVFGELAILYNAKRFASIKAASRAKVWKIDRSTFRTIMLISGSMEREENLNFLRSAPFLKDLPEDVLLKVVDLLKRVFFPTNTCIIKQGDIGNDFFIIRGGTVTIRKCNEYGDERIVDRRKRGEYFGEQALLNEERRQASVYSDAPGTECLKLDRESFISYLGTIPELKNKPIDRIVVPEERRRPSTTNKMYDHIELSHLERVATLGAGAFGRVDLVLYKKTQTFALKIIKKVEVIRQDQIDHIYSEKLVMSMCQSCPFIIELYKTYRDSKYVYFLMEVCLGGDVWTIMHQRKYFDERTAKFIVACVVEAFDFLHSRNIVYRDLKPENLMLTVDGYCKLVDFGFAKRLNPNYKTNTFAGTPEYVAPEIILDRGHDKAIDYWALGVLIHELLIGKPPFRGQSHIKIYQAILGGIESVKMSARIPKPAQHLIKHLCKQLPAERLGYQRKGITDIKKHSWFDGFDWVKLEEKKMVSPIKRPVASNTDLSYFSPCMDDNDVPPDENSGWDNEF